MTKRYRGKKETPIVPAKDSKSVGRSAVGAKSNKNLNASLPSRALVQTLDVQNP